MADKQSGSSFLHRWSTRKAEARDGVPSLDADDGAEEALQAEPVVEPAVEPEPIPDLPDVDTLDAASDYTAFLGKNVPQDIANLALRKLWRSDPLLANLDGLNDYDEDFSKVGMASEVVKTLYKVGKGFVTADDAVAEAPLIEDAEAIEPLESESALEENAPLSGEIESEATDKVTSPDGEGEV